MIMNMERKMTQEFRTVNIANEKVTYTKCTNLIANHVILVYRG